MMLLVPVVVRLDVYILLWKVPQIYCDLMVPVIKHSNVHRLAVVHDIPWQGLVPFRLYFFVWLDITFMESS